MKKIYFVLFRISCFTLFVYQVFVIINEYQNQEPITRQRNERQEDYPKPLFCFSTNEFNYENFNTTLNITFDEYTRGIKWRTDDMSEEELFYFLTPRLSDLISKIKIAKNTDPVGDSYETIKFPIQEDQYKEVDTYNNQIQ